jgi:hypothetical protein
MTTWTNDMIADRFAEAVDTVRRLPPVRVQGYFNVWPIIVRQQWELLARDDSHRPFPPSPQAIDRMMETMKWVVHLQVEERHLLWMRAEGYEWDIIGKRFACNRVTAWRRWQRVLGKVAEQLNGATPATHVNAARAIS